MAYLYHVTYFSRLDGIARRGLRPGHGRSIGAAIYDTHRKGAIFLTEKSGVGFWAERAEQWAVDQSDDPLGDGLVPVVLRVPDIDECEEDEPGTRDARADAWRCTASIAADDIQVWTGRRWAPVEDYWDDVEPGSALDDEGYFKASSPLVPNPARRSRAKKKKSAAKKRPTKRKRPAKRKAPKLTFGKFMLG